MDLAEFAIRVWQTKWRTLLFAVIAAAIGIAFTYQVSFSPAGLSPRALRFGVAQTSMLVDAGESPLATTDVSASHSNLLASDLAFAMNSSLVSSAVARAVGAQPEDIGIQEQVVQNLPRTLKQPHEAQVANALLAGRSRYSVLIRNVQGTFVIQIFTQAPTGTQAIKMADTVSRVMHQHVATLGQSGNIPPAERVVLRRLGAATGGLVDRSATRNAAVLIGLVAFLLLMIAGFTVDRLRRSRRDAAATAEPAESPADGPATAVPQS